jgi:Skp family chaperone for outer membrane proteins
MKKSIYAFLLAILLLISTSASFSDEDKKKESFIAVVDLHSILENSTAVKDLKSKFEKIAAELREQMSAKEVELNKEGVKLVELKGQKDKKLYEKEAGSFAKKLSEAQKEYQQQKVKLEKSYSDGIMQINKNIVSIIKEFCKTKGCHIVLPSSQVLYAEDSLNISFEILDKLNQQICSINVKF